MKVRIISPDTTLYEGEAKLVQLPGTGGMFELLDKHATIIASLKQGTIKLQDAEGERRFDILAGVAKGQQNELLILTQ